MTEARQPTTEDDDPGRTATYLRGLRNGLSAAAKMLDVSASEIRLHAGEMTAQEMRTAKAVLRWKMSEIAAKAEAVNV